ncbi:MAG: hypothetical protein AAGG59_17475 [Bacteroidota bacterium]
MGRTSFLSESKELTLTIVLILPDSAYGTTLVKTIKEHPKPEG